MLLDDPSFLKEAEAMMSSDTFQRLFSVGLNEYEASKSGASTEWEFNSNKSAVAGAKDFFSFLNRMVIDRIELDAEEEGDNEPEHSDP